MSGRVTAVLIAVGLVLGAYVYFVDGPQQQEQAAVARSARRVFALEKSAITRMELPLAVGPGSLVLAREPGSSDPPTAARWRIEQPIATQADTFAVDGLLTAVEQLETVFELDPPGPELSSYGLGDDALEIVLTPASGEPVRLRLGDETPVDDHLYVLLSTRPGKLLGVDRARARALRPDLTAIRDRSLVSLPPNRVGGLRVEIDGAPLVTLARSAARADDDGSEEPLGADAWTIEAPIQSTGDAGRIFRLLQELYFARASSVIDAPGAPDEYGLDAPAARLTLTPIPGTGDAPMLELAIGKRGEQIFARRDGAGPVYETPERMLEAIPTEVFDYRFKRVIGIAPQRVAQVEFAYPRTGETVRVARGESGWTSEQAEAIALDPYRVEDLVFAIEAIDAIDVVREPADRAALGLEPPQVRITFRDEDGVVLGELSLGELVPGAGLAAVSSQSDAVWRLLAELDDPFPLSFEILRTSWASDAEVDPEAQPDADDDLGPADEAAPDASAEAEVDPLADDAEAAETAPEQ